MICSSDGCMTIVRHQRRGHRRTTCHDCALRLERDRTRKPCDACGTLTHAQVHCAHVPETAEPWCAWCGDELPAPHDGRRCFCAGPCAHAYAADRFERFEARVLANNAKAPRMESRAS